MTDEMTQSLPDLAALYAESMERYHIAQLEALGKSEDLGFQIAMKRDSERLLALRAAIEKQGGVISGKSVFDSSGANLSTWVTNGP